MNRIQTYTLAVFLLIFGTIAWAQEPKDNSQPPQSQERQAQEPRPEPRNEAAPPRQNEARPPQQEPERPPRQANPPREESRPAHQEHGDAHAQTQPGQHARPAGKSAHIPDEKFRASFGRQHGFVANRVISQTTIVPGQTQFVFAGYTFIFLDPWPAEWLFTDDCFIDFVDGDYFLFDAFHPGFGIALFVVR